MKSYCFRAGIISAVIIFSGCAYFNTFYNAQQYYKKAYKETQSNLSGKPSGVELQNYQKAIQKCRKLIDKFPDSEYVTDAYFLMAKSYYYRREYLQSVDALTALQEKDSLNKYGNESPLWLAQCSWKLDEFAQAERLITEFLEQDIEPEAKVKAYILLAEMAENQKVDSLMIQHYLSAIEISTNVQDAAQVEYRLANYFMQKGNLDQASEYYSNVLKHTQDQITERIVRIQKVIIEKQRGNLDKAIDRFNEMLANSDFEDLWAAIHLQIADIYLHDNEIEKSISRYERVIDENENTDYEKEAFFNLAEIYFSEYQDYELAKEYFQNVSGNRRTSGQRGSGSGMSGTGRSSSSGNRGSKQQTEEANLLRKMSIDEIKMLTEQRLKILNFHENLTEQLTNLSIDEEKSLADSLQKSVENVEREFPEISDSLITAQQDTLETSDSLQIQPKKDLKNLRLIGQIEFKLAELFYWEMERQDSAIAIFTRLAGDTIDSDISLRSLRVLEYYHNDLGDSTIADYLSERIAELAKQNADNPSEISDAPYPPANATVTVFVDSATELYFSNKFDQAIPLFQSVLLEDSTENQATERALFTLGWDAYERLYDAELSQNYLSEFQRRFPKSTAKNEILRKVNLLKEILVDSTEIAIFDSTSVDSTFVDTVKKKVSLPKTSLSQTFPKKLSIPDSLVKIPDAIPIISSDASDTTEKQPQFVEKVKIEEEIIAENVPPKTEQKFIIHEVQPGDWLSKLAIRYQNVSSVEEMISFSETIQKDNPDLIQDIDLIQPGWKIKILSNQKK